MSDDGDLDVEHMLAMEHEMEVERCMAQQEPPDDIQYNQPGESRGAASSSSTCDSAGAPAALRASALVSLLLLQLADEELLHGILYGRRVQIAVELRNGAASHLVQGAICNTIATRVGVQELSYVVILHEPVDDHPRVIPRTVLGDLLHAGGPHRLGRSCSLRGRRCHR